MKSKGGKGTGVVKPTDKDRAIKPFPKSYSKWANLLNQQKAKQNSSKRSALDVRHLVEPSSVRKTMRKLRSASAFMNIDNKFGKKGGRKSRRRNRKSKRRIRK
jgi:hypothetical protein